MWFQLVKIFCFSFEILTNLIFEFRVRLTSFLSIFRIVTNQNNKSMNDKYKICKDRLEE